MVQEQGKTGRWLTGFATSRWTIAVILALAIALRLGLMLWLPLQPFSDGAWYLGQAEAIAHGMGYQEAGLPTAFWPVGYPALLAGTILLFGPGLFGALLLNLIAAAATVGLILWFARRLGIPPLGARLAALLYALYPAHIAYAGQPVTEPVATALIMAAFALLIAGRGGRPGLSFLSGLIFGLCTLIKAQMLYFPIGAIIVLWLAFHDKDWKKAVRAAILVYAGIALVVAPWTLRNYRELHAFVPVSTNGGITLYTGANDQATGTYSDGRPLWQVSPCPYSKRVACQVEADRAFRTAAVTWIEAHPGRWAWLGVRKMGIIWVKDTDAFWAFEDSYPDPGPALGLLRAIDQLYYLLLVTLGMAGLLAGLYGVIRRNRQTAPLILLGCMPAFVTLTGFVFTGQVRFHFPAMPFLIVAAGWTLAALTQRRSRKAA